MPEPTDAPAATGTADEARAHHAARGDAFAAVGQTSAALHHYRLAYALLPEPADGHPEATWLHAAVADAHFQAGDFDAARVAMRRARETPGGDGNPFVHLRLGQASLELGDEGTAAAELRRAYAIGGRRLFAEDDPKYWRWLLNEIAGV